MMLRLRMMFRRGNLRGLLLYQIWVYEEEKEEIVRRYIGVRGEGERRTSHKEMHYC